MQSDAAIPPGPCVPGACAKDEAVKAAAMVAIKAKFVIVESESRSGPVIASSSSHVDGHGWPNTVQVFTRQNSIFYLGHIFKVTGTARAGRGCSSATAASCEWPSLSSCMPGRHTQYACSTKKVKQLFDVGHFFSCAFQPGHPP